MTDTAPDTDTATDATDPPRPRWQTILIRIGITLAIASVIPWLWAITQTPNAPKPPGFLEDRSFPEAAEPICAATMEAVGQFPRAIDAESPQERAVVIRDTSAELSAMTDRLRAVVPDNDDAEWIVLWIDDWDAHIEDRLDFARRLEQNGASEEFLESTRANVQLSRSLDRFATVNLMDSCQTPGDV